MAEPSPSWRLFGVSASKRGSAAFLIFPHFLFLLAPILSTPSSTPQDRGPIGTTPRTSRHDAGRIRTMRDTLRGTTVDSRRRIMTFPRDSGSPNTQQDPASTKSLGPAMSTVVSPLRFSVSPFHASLSSSPASPQLVWSSQMTISGQHINSPMPTLAFVIPGSCTRRVVTFGPPSS
ncbi:hypothetical protein FB446DRAFT_795858 [Lentinula raphanica]|nr:hypothetical protein FB446DRAFT_795858 [Lentinula raphanica]